MPRRPALTVASAFVVLVAAGCGSTASQVTASTTAGSSTTMGGSTTSAPAGGSTTSAAAGGSSTSGPTGSSGASGSALWVAGPVPAVTGATDMKGEPTIAAGSSPAPTVVTGKDLVLGTGAQATPSSTVLVQYVGTIYGTGKVFDASWTDSGPTRFPLNGVIPGFKDAIVGMKVGGRREVVIPPAESYGSSANGPIPANSTLVFVVDLLGVS